MNRPIAHIQSPHVPPSFSIPLLAHATLIPVLALSLSACSSTATKNIKPDAPPSLTSPEVNRVWVPDSIEGEKYIMGHWIYVIKKTSVWSK